MAEKDYTFTLWQLSPRTHSQINSYVIRTAAHKLIIIDGGTKGDAAYLRRFIRDRGNHVHAWLISHTHYDHVGALTEILNTPEHIRIDKIYGTFPDDEWMKIHQNANAHRTQLELKEAMEKARQPLLELSPGQTIRFGDITFTILSSINPELTMNAVNNQSVTWRVDGGKIGLVSGRSWGRGWREVDAGTIRGSSVRGLCADGASRAGRR